jgi:hypothetical protein
MPSSVNRPAHTGRTGRTRATDRPAQPRPAPALTLWTVDCDLTRLMITDDPDPLHRNCCLEPSQLAPPSPRILPQLRQAIGAASYRGPRTEAAGGPAAGSMDSTPLLVATQEDLARRTIGVGRRGSAQFDIEPDDDATGGAPGSGSSGAAAAGGVAAVWHERGVREWCYALLEPNRPPSMAQRRAKASSQLCYKRSRAGQAGLWIERVLIMVIVLASLSFVLSTLDWGELLGDGEDAPSNAQQRVEATFEVVEWVAALTFSTEYVARLCVIGVNDEFRGWRGLLWYAVTPFALLDLVAVVPFWIGVGLGDSANDAVRATQSVRLLRILRFMFLGEWGGAFADMGQAFSKNKAVLVVSGCAGVAVWVIVASLYYLAERDNPQMVWDSNSFCALSGERCGPDDDPPFNVGLGDACPADDEGNPRGDCLGEPRFGNILVSMYALASTSRHLPSAHAAAAAAAAATPWIDVGLD